MTKSIFNLKFFLFIKIFFICFFIFSRIYADDNKAEKDAVSIGSQEAQIKIKVFSSFTCPHCASFHIKVVPKIKKEFQYTNQDFKN